MKRNRLPFAIATLAIVAIGAFAAWMTDIPRLIQGACNAPEGKETIVKITFDSTQWPGVTDRGFLALNNRDNDGLPGADNTTPSSSGLPVPTADADLKKITLSVTPVIPGATISGYMKLTYNSGVLRMWDSPTKNTYYPPAQAWPVPATVNVWVEGFHSGWDNNVLLEYIEGKPIVECKDKVEIVSVDIDLVAYDARRGPADPSIPENAEDTAGALVAEEPSMEQAKLLLKGGGGVNGSGASRWIVFSDNKGGALVSTLKWKRDTWGTGISVPTVETDLSVVEANVDTDLLFNVFKISGSPAWQLGDIVTVKYVWKGPGLNIIGNDIVVLKELRIVLHPKSYDFTTGMEDRVMISAGTKSPPYYTVYQDRDRYITIKAEVSPPRPAGSKIKLRVRNPDPPDLSPYSPKLSNPNQLDAAIGPGQLVDKDSLDTSGVAEKELLLITAGGMSIAEADLLITDHCSGDNYLVECSMDHFATVNDTTCIMVAWKRLFLQELRMYHRDACRHLTANAIQPATVLFLDNKEVAGPGTRPFPDKTLITVFDNDHEEDCKVLNGNLDDRIVIESPGIAASQPYLCGYTVVGGKGAAVRRRGTPTFELDRSMLLGAYGSDTHGTPNKAVFVEIETGGTPRRCAHVGELVLTYAAGGATYDKARLISEYLDIWAGARVNNTIPAIACEQVFWNNNYRGGMSHISAVGAGKRGIAVSSGGDWDPYRGEHLVHEIGHQFGGHVGVTGGNLHVDQKTDHTNLNGDDNCVMSYKNDFANGKCEFCAEVVSDCAEDIRTQVDPIQ